MQYSLMRKRLVVRLLIVLIIICIVPRTTGESWPMFGHDSSHSRYSTSNAPDENNILWSRTTGGEIYSSPAVADDKVYVGSWDGFVYCLDALTGEILWSKSIGSYVDSSPAVADGIIYIGSSNGNIYGLNTSTGEILWSKSIGSYVGSSPAVIDGKVYIGSSDDKVYCLNADSMERSTLARLMIKCIV
jgi:outer membrane protein assembly factor BamB